MCDCGAKSEAIAQGWRGANPAEGRSAESRAVIAGSCDRGAKFTAGLNLAHVTDCKKEGLPSRRSLPSFFSFVQRLVIRKTT